VYFNLTIDVCYVCVFLFTGYAATVTRERFFIDLIYWIIVEFQLSIFGATLRIVQYDRSKTELKLNETTQNAMN